MFFIVFFKTALGRKHSGKVSKNCSVTFISEESPYDFRLIMSKKCAAPQIFFAYFKRSFKDLLFRRDSNLVQILLYLVATVLNRFMRALTRVAKDVDFYLHQSARRKFKQFDNLQILFLIGAFPFKEKIQAKNSLKQAQKKKKSYICVAFECFVWSYRVTGSANVHALIGVMCV